MDISGGPLMWCTHWFYSWTYNRFICVYIKTTLIEIQWLVVAHQWIDIVFQNLLIDNVINITTTHLTTIFQLSQHLSQRGRCIDARQRLQVLWNWLFLKYKDGVGGYDEWEPSPLGILHYFRSILRLGSKTEHCTVEKVYPKITIPNTHTQKYSYPNSHIHANTDNQSCQVSLSVLHSPEPKENLRNAAFDQPLFVGSKRA